jgi:autotransporter-associated beta strand protein
MKQPRSPNATGSNFMYRMLALAAIRGCSYSTALAGRRSERHLALATLAGTAAAIGIAADASGFTLTESPTAPTLNVIASQLTDQSGAIIGNQDYTDNGGPPGQTFVVGGTGNFQMQAFTILGGGGHGGTSSGSSGVFWNIQIGSVDLGTGAITELLMEASNVTYSSNADYLTFTLDTPVTLSAGTTYSFSLYSSAGWYGLAHSSGDVYAGGTAFNNDQDTTQTGNQAPRRTFNGFVSPRAYDYIFAVQGLSLAPGKIWSGASSGIWNTTTANFTGLTYADGDNVTFGDFDGTGTTPPVTRNITIQAGGVSPGSTMTVNNSTGDYTFTGTINGATNLTTLVKNGTSAATLAGTTDNPGLNGSVNAGTLVLAKTSSASVHALASLSIADGGTARLSGSGDDQIADTGLLNVGGSFDLNGKNESVDGLFGAVTGTISNGGTVPSTITVGAGNGGGTFPGLISNGPSGTVALVKAGSGVQTLIAFNTFTGGTTVNGGTLALGAGGMNGTLAPNSTVTVNANGTLRLDVSDALGYTAGSTAPVSVNGGLMTIAGGAHATLSGVILTGGTLGALGEGDFASSASSYFFDGPIVTHASPAVSTINAPSIAIRGSPTGGAATPVTFNVARGTAPADLVVLSSIADSGAGLIKTGAGIAVFSAPNTFDGPATISEGTLSATSNQALGLGPVLLNGGTLQLAGVHASIGINFVGGGTNSPSPGGASVTGVAGVVPMANWNNITGSSGGGIPLNDFNGFAGVANLDSFTATNTWSTGSTNPLLNGYIDNTNTTPDAQQVTVSGIPYSSYNVYAYFGSDGAGRTGSVSLNGTSYFYRTRGDLGDYVLTTDTTGAVNPSANYAIFSSVSGNTFTINQSRGSNNSGLMALEIVQSGVSPLSLSNGLNVTSDSIIDVTGASTAEVTGLVSIGANQLSVTGGSSGPGAAYSLTLGIAPLGSLGGVSLGGSPTFNVANNGTGAGVLTLGPITETVAGSGLTKANNGTLILTGVSTYTGATVINGGTLIVSGSINGTNAVAINAGGTLSGAGSITTPNAITGAVGAQLAPGLQPFSPGTLNVTASVLDLIAELTGSSQSLLFDLATPGASSKVVLTSGMLNIGTDKLAFGDFQFQADTGFGEGTYTLFDTSSPIVGSLDPISSHLAGIIGGLPATLAFGDSGHDIILIVIPEPNSIALLIGGIGVMAGLSRRLRSSTHFEA